MILSFFWLGARFCLKDYSDGNQGNGVKAMTERQRRVQKQTETASEDLRLMGYAGPEHR